MFRKFFLSTDELLLHITTGLDFSLGTRGTVPLANEEIVAYEIVNVAYDILVLARKVPIVYTVPLIQPCISQKAVDFLVSYLWLHNNLSSISCIFITFFTFIAYISFIISHIF